MPNMGAIISSHNAKVLSPEPLTAPPATSCNCRRPAQCPLNGECKISCIVYKATVTAPNKPAMSYFGLTEGEFKYRYNNHTHSFRHEGSTKDTELSKYLWELKGQDIEGEVKWSIVHRAASYKCGSRRCDLCLSEKLAIAMADPNTTLSKRSEIISKYRHRKKYACKNVR